MSSPAYDMRSNSPALAVQPSGLLQSRTATGCLRSIAIPDATLAIVSVNTAPKSACDVHITCASLDSLRIELRRRQHTYNAGEERR